MCFLPFKRIGTLALISFGSIYIFDTYFESPTDRAQRREIAFLEDRLGKMDADMQDMAIILGDISDRDDAIYRSIFGVESYPSHLRNPGSAASTAAGRCVATTTAKPSSRRRAVGGIAAQAGRPEPIV